MNDLLGKSFMKCTDYVDLKKDVMRDVEMGDVNEDLQGDQSLNTFFQEVNLVNIDMETVKTLLANLQKENKESKNVHKATAMKELRDRMDGDVEEVLRKAKSIKAKLEDLDKANIANRKNPGCEAGTPADRARTGVTSSLRKKLKDLMGEFQTLRERIMGDYKETVERRYFTVTGQKPDDKTVEQMIETGESENFLQRAIQEQGRGQVMDTIREFQERHDAVKEIEKNLIELHQIFLDMAVLVEAQGEQLNDIEHYVYHANQYIDKGRQDLETAKKYRGNTRKYMCIAILILLIFILIVLVPIATSFKH